MKIHLEKVSVLYISNPLKIFNLRVSQLLVVVFNGGLNFGWSSLENSSEGFHWQYPYLLLETPNVIREKAHVDMRSCKR